MPHQGTTTNTTALTMPWPLKMLEHRLNRIPQVDHLLNMALLKRLPWDSIYIPPFNATAKNYTTSTAGVATVNGASGAIVLNKIPQLDHDLDWVGLTGSVNDFQTGKKRGLRLWV